LDGPEAAREDWVDPISLAQRPVRPVPKSRFTERVVERGLPVSDGRDIRANLLRLRNWFAKRPRFHVHFTPTYGSWLNLVERWFAELTNKQLRRGVHRSVAQLKAAIREFIAAHHAKATPFMWTKTADEILASIARFAQRSLDFQAPFIQRTMRSGH
jgi:transposase